MGEIPNKSWGISVPKGTSLNALESGGRKRGLTGHVVELMSKSVERANTPIRKDSRGSTGLHPHVGNLGVGAGVARDAGLA